MNRSFIIRSLSLWIYLDEVGLAQVDSFIAIRADGIFRHRMIEDAANPAEPDPVKACLPYQAIFPIPLDR